MENKSSKDYVTELLKQLEELKRKKALKEKKLQKLKSSAQVDQVSRNSNTSLNKTCDKNFNSENNTYLVAVERNYNNSHKNENYCTYNDSKFAKVGDFTIKSDEENYGYGKLDVVEHQFGRNNVKGSETPKYNKTNGENPVLTVNNSIEKIDSVCKNFVENENCHALTNSAPSKSSIVGVKNSSSFFSDELGSSNFDDHIICSGSIEKFYDEVNESKCNSTEINNIQESKENKNNITMSADTKVVPFPTYNVMKEDSTLDNSSEKSNNSSKSLPKVKIVSDTLDDSLSSNMSCFLSSELFLANGEKKEPINGNKSTIACAHEKLEQIETHVKLIASDPKMVLPVPDPVSSCKDNQNNNFDFSFPKFSTPTDGIIFLSSSEENVVNSEDKSVKQNGSDDVGTVSFATEDVCKMNKVCIDDIQPENKFDPAKISLILGKGLSSVLDAHYESPKKPLTLKNKILSNITHERKHNYSQEVTGETSSKRRKLFSNTSVVYLDRQSKFDYRIRSSDSLHGPFENLAKSDKATLDVDIHDTDVFLSNSDSFDGFQNSPDKGIIFANNSPDHVKSQVIKTIDGLVTKVCEDHITYVEVDAYMKSQTGKDMKVDSEILIVPETEGLGLYFSKDTEDFHDTSVMSESLKDFHVEDCILNTSTQSKLESPVINKIVQAVKSAKDSFVSRIEGSTKSITGKENCDDLLKIAEEKESFDNSVAMDTSFLEDGTEELGNYKQVPYLNEKNVQETLTVDDSKQESNLNFICSLYGASNEAVIDVEIVVFSRVKYAFIQHKTQIHVWRQEKKKEWIKIFNHQTEDMLALVKICVTMDEDNLVVVMLLTNDEQYCLQFLLFEKDARVIKLMENTHWLDKRHSQDSVLLCGLDGLMFATAQVKNGHEVSLHAFINLKDCPRLMTAVLGSTDNVLCSLCKINKLPNALMGINDSMLYIWHVLEARLVTAVSLHPHDYLPIKQCFWATVENGLIYFLTTCEGQNKHQVCQLLVANLATGFCQSAMTYSSQPSRSQIAKITKAVYMEPFLVISDLNGAFLWCVTEEHCCATLFSKADITSVAISRDFENWGLIVVGSKLGYITCYGLN